MSTVALFGTSADPPTCGHRALLQGLLGQFPDVVTWASDNPLKHHAAPLDVRTDLLRELVATIDDPRLQLVQALSSPWAIETLRRARGLWPEAELVFVVGSDLAAQIPGWRHAEEVLRLCRLAIVPRAGWPPGDADLRTLRAHGASLEILPLNIPASASSRIRAHPDPEQIPGELMPLLVRHRLYGFS